MPKGRPQSSSPTRRLRNEDYTDRELLAIIDKEAGDGWATSEDIAQVLGFTDREDGRSPVMRVVSRLNWMRHYGFIEREDEGGQAHWQLTEVGREIMSGKLNRSVEGALNRMGAGEGILLMRALTRRESNEAVGHALRREFQHNIAQRKQRSA